MFNRREGGVCINGKNYRWYFIEKEFMWQVQDVQNNRLFKIRDSYHTRDSNRQKYLTEKLNEYLNNPKGEDSYMVVYNKSYLKYLDDNEL